MGGGTYLATLAGIYGSSLLTHRSPFSRRIYSEAELEDAVEEEGKRLGLDTSKINIKRDRLFESLKKPDCHDVSKILDGSPDSTRVMTRHELYHIKKGDPEPFSRTFSLLHYIFVAEPRAILYASLGIEL